MNPFKHYKRLKFAVAKLLNLKVGVKIKDILIFLIVQIMVLANVILEAIESGAL